MEDIINRFISYVSIDTQSDPGSNTTPSTKKQWDLANKLVGELKAMGMEEVSIDQNAYVMATLASNCDAELPTIGFIAHMDTTPDFSGTNVNPRLIDSYDGKDIVLNADKNIVLSPDYFEEL
ncbi:MAG: peptidase T, partial [Eudoraea sp.]|nr:peptidase T [Eudoraea sp.]